MCNTAIERYEIFGVDPQRDSRDTSQLLDGFSTPTNNNIYLLSSKLSQV